MSATETDVMTCSQNGHFWTMGALLGLVRVGAASVTGEGRPPYVIADVQRPSKPQPVEARHLFRIADASRLVGTSSAICSAQPEPSHRLGGMGGGRAFHQA